MVADDPQAGEVAAALGLPEVVAATWMPGFDATVWRCELADGRTVAVRLLRAGLAAAREVANLELAARHAQPAPRVLAAGTVSGRAAIVMTWCRGRAIGELLLAGDSRQLGVPFGRAHAAMHRPVDSGALCHLDYHPFNVLVDTAADGSTEVTGIVDWTNARVADRRTDLAATEVLLALAPEIMAGLAAGMDGFAAQWRAGYAQLMPIPDEAELAPFLADAAGRQVAEWRRRASGNDDAAQLAARVADFAEDLYRRWSC